MRLVDALPFHLEARALSYGYDAKLAQPRSIQNLDDIASTFPACLKSLISNMR